MTDAGPIDLLSMEFLEGETLFARLRRGRLAPAEARTIARQLAQGLAAAHREGILHGDLKSTNVMLTRSASGELRAVITDFGLATGLRGNSSTALSSALRGHPSYIAPERYRGSKGSVQSDIYSLGAILYELVAGRTPFDENTTWQHRLERPPQPPGKVAGGVPHGWNRVILRCLDPDPTRRFRSADGLLTAIHGLNSWKWRVAAAIVTVMILAGLTRVPAIHDLLFPPPPPVRLAIPQFSGPSGSVVRASLEDLSRQLFSLPGAKTQLSIVPAERLGATHLLTGSASEQNGNLRVQAEVTEKASGLKIGSYSSVLRPAEIGNLSTALAGLVTRSFNLPSSVPARINPAAQPLYSRGIDLLLNSATQYEEAISLFNQALQLDPASPLLYAGLAEAHLQKYSATDGPSSLELAAEAVSHAEALHPDSARVQLIRARLEEARGAPARALPYAERASQVDPQNTEVWRELAAAYRLLERYPEAIRAYQKAIALASNYYAPHQDLGFLFSQLGRYRDAAEEFTIESKLAPNVPEGFSYAGAMLLSSGRDAEAEEALHRSLLIGETRGAYINLGVLRTYQRRDIEAAELFDNALRISPDSTLARVNLADSQRRLSRLAEAKGNYLRIAALLDGPRDAFSRALLSYIRARLGDPVGARRQAVTAIQMAPSDWRVVRWAVLSHETLGERQLSLPLLESAPAEVLDDLARHPDLKRFSEDPHYEQVRQRAK
jgi:serine/threonine-protein kinase